MKQLALALSLTALPGLALAGDDACECGKAGCEHTCTCSQGVCPLHRPKAEAPPKEQRKADAPPPPRERKDKAR
jgi:hypothetical protein